jgi:hypothetical protein
MNELEHVWFGWGMEWEHRLRVSMFALKEGMYCPWAVNIILGGVRLLAFLSVLCLWREKLRILAHAHLVSYLSVWLVVGCTITVAHSLGRCLLFCMG